MITCLEGMTKEVWLRRCADRFEKRVSGATKQDCAGWAETCLDNLDGDLMNHPEDAADEELSYWGN